MNLCILKFMGIYEGYGVSRDIDSAAVIQNDRENMRKATWRCVKTRSLMSSEGRT